MDISSFYAAYDESDPFGNFPSWRSNPHRGSDFPHGAGTAIPCFLSGVVVRSEYHSGLGWVVVVKADAGFYVGFSHMIQQGIAVGTRVGFGSILGAVGNTGTLSFGNHTHITGSWSSDRPWTGGVFDIWPTIFAAVNHPPAAPAAGTTQKEDYDMAQGFYPRNGEVGTAGYGDIYYQADVNEPLQHLNAPQWIVAAAQGARAADLSRAQIDQIVRQSGVYVLDRYGRKQRKPENWTDPSKSYVSLGGYAVFLPGA